MILLLGDFPAWLPIFTLIGGVTTAIIAGLVTAAAAGATAAGVRSAVEGNWPWEDPEAWILDQLKGATGGIGTVVSAARGEPSLQESLKGETSGSGAGSGGSLQAATGQGPLQLENAALAAGGGPAPGFKMGAGSQPQPMGGQPGGYAHTGHPTDEQMAELGRQGVGSFSTPEAMEQRAVDRWSGGGASRYDSMDAEAGSKPSRGKILAGAGKDIGIGLGTTAASIAIPYVGSLIGPAVEPAAQISSGVIKEAAKTAGATVPAVAGVGAKVAPAAAPNFVRSAMDAVRSGLQIVPETIGNTATGVLQQSLFGAGKGAITSALQGQDPLRGAAMGGAGGVVGGIAGYGAQQFAPAPVPTIQPNPFPMPDIGAPDFVGGTAPGAPTLGSFAASKIPGLAGSIASAGVGQMMQPPMPSQPGAPVYSSRPSYYDVYDIGGQNATYPSRRPYWG